MVEKGCFWAKSGKEVKITRFNESGLMRWGWLLMMGGEGTIFTHALFFWTQLTVLLVIAFGTALITYAFQSGLAPLGAGMNWMNFGHKDIAEVYEVLDLIDLTPRRPSSPRSPASPIPWLVRNKLFSSCSTVCRLQISPILGTL